MNKIIALIALTLLLTACGTTDSSLKEQGRSDAYVMGFHDGRHSGMREEGNNFEHFIQDRQRFDEDPEYRSGWLAGEAEGIKLQDQANMAGDIAAGTYSSYQVGKEVDKQTDYDKIARDALKDVDTSSLNSLDKD